MRGLLRTLLQACTVFVGGAKNLRASKVAVRAVENIGISLPDKIGEMYLGPPGKNFKGPLSTEFSTRAENKVAILTPELGTEAIGAWLSLAPNLLAMLMIGTAGMLIEIQRFFPYSMYW